MDRPTCSTCVYWQEIRPDDPVGHCRIRAPIFFEHQVYPRDAILSEDHYGMHPATPYRFWCGEHPDFPAYIAARKAKQ